MAGYSRGRVTGPGLFRVVAASQDQLATKFAKKNK
jgi:hypothetical protein